MVRWFILPFVFVISLSCPPPIYTCIFGGSKLSFPIITFVFSYLLQHICFFVTKIVFSLNNLFSFHICSSTFFLLKQNSLDYFFLVFVPAHLFLSSCFGLSPANGGPLSPLLLVKNKKQEQNKIFF